MPPTDEADELPIERPHPHDLAAVASLDARSFPSGWGIESLATDLDRDGRGVWFRVLREGTSVVAYLVAWWLADEVHVIRVAVEPARRREGHARRLLEALLEMAATAGARLVTLEVRASNRAARALYGALGFTEVGVRPGYYPDRDPPEDAVLLTRWMVPPDPSARAGGGEGDGGGSPEGVGGPPGRVGG